MSDPEPVIEHAAHASANAPTPTSPSPSTNAKRASTPPSSKEPTSHTENASASDAHLSDTLRSPEATSEDANTTTPRPPSLPPPAALTDTDFASPPPPAGDKTPRPPSPPSPASVRRPSALQHKHQHTASSSASGLAALLSPTQPPAPAPFPLRDSIAPTDDLADVPLDGGLNLDDVAEGEDPDDGEPRFSTVALTQRGSTGAIKSPVGEAPPPPWGKDEDEENEHAAWVRQRAVGGSARSSVDGAARIQEEFRRLHNETPEGAAGAVDWEFWGAVVSDYQAFAADNSERLARAIERGIPDTLRGMMWQLMSASKDPELEAEYIRLIKESSPHEKAIMRDLGRTFPHHAFFTDGQGIGQENLFNVLKAYSLRDPQVGYCQGLPFVVAVLLLNMPDEEAFSLLVRLMYSYDLRGHFLPEMPKLQLRLFQFDRLIEELLPVLHLHFVRQGVKSSMFCSQWFLTLFSYRFPLEIVYRIFDNCLASGIEAIFGFALVLLQRNEARLLALKFDELVAFLNAQIIDTYKDDPDPSAPPDAPPRWRTDDFVRDATALRITPFMLDAYAHEYEEMVRARDAHLLEVDFLRRSNRNLSSQVNALEASLAQLNQEHVDILNELVRSRLQNEELEGELVRYKLLYAESVHKNEDSLSLSSNRFSAANASLSNGGGSGGGGSKRPSLQSMISGFTRTTSSTSS